MPAFLCLRAVISDLRIRPELRSWPARRGRALILASLLFATPGVIADDGATVAQMEIEALIAAVETSNCDFIRNGDRHDAASAADHLRLKYRRGRRYADTAEHFIERLASKSSWSGKPYTIECDGNAEPSGDWLRARLTSLRS